MSSRDRPLRNPRLALAPDEDGYLAYDIDADRLHRLNPAAALILELCDGNRSAETLCEELAGLGSSFSRDACAEWIEKAKDEGLLNSSQTGGPGPPAAGELASRSRKLRHAGQVLAAYVCQRHATLIFPCGAREWMVLGELAHIVGRRAEAQEAYERYLELEPADAEIAHILIALRDEPAPPRAPDRCIQYLYSRFAANYEDNMCGSLDYRAPAKLIEALASELREARDLNVLDLGCGTGLAGRELRPRARCLTGVDLSPEMIDHAWQSGVYDALHITEITRWLASPSGEKFDVIAACDSLIYFGDLHQIVVPAARLLRPGGWMAFTLERNDGEPFRLTDSGRYSHTSSHVAAVAEDADLSVASISDATLRYEYGEPVIGLVVVLRAG